MAKSIAFSVLPLAVSAFVIGCSSSDQPALCSSLDDLKASVDNVRDTQEGQNGLSALRADLLTVKDDVADVIDDAQAQYSGQAAQIRSDVESLQSAVATATTTRSSADISAAWKAAQTLGANVRELAEDAKSTC